MFSPLNIFQSSNGMSSAGHHHFKTDSGLSRLGCALATQLQLTAAKTSGTLTSLTHRLSRHTNGEYKTLLILFIKKNPFSFIIK